jgi:alkanesulfonate monooxygenase SsuD/methylene tetrahydromethanopterin reductase-like flavin-dependent oxidoreductase (luciferase family)
MKFTWFHLMPYRFLPEDFTTKHHSVWVDIPRNLYDPKAGHRLYNDYLDQLEFADEMGFDGLGVNEHHQNAYGMMPSPNLMGAAMARRTRRANLVILGNSIALYNPPIRVAEEFAMIDVLSGGRLVAGFPVGTSMDTNYCYGEVPATLREKYKEAHDLILKAWTEKEMFSFNGKFTKLRYVNLWPKPLQQPRPRYGFPVAARSKRGTSAPTTAISTAFSRTSVISRPKKSPTATGMSWRRRASRSIPTRWGLRRR